ncbi:MAG TPA: PstS family phosphate ABC transporter substrate-binding protein [Vicinamibacterales bacterium]|jgi:phosphate transport system substrate-binding protein
MGASRVARLIWRVSWILLGAVVLFVGACGPGRKTVTTEPILVDGSSTLFPLTTTVAEEFQMSRPGTKVEVRFSGTSAGFDRFCSGETDIQDASRPIESREIAACQAAGIGYLELPIAHDGLTVIVHASNSWAESMTTVELKALWEPKAQGKVIRWHQIRRDWPDRPLSLFGPGPRSGTFDFFTLVIMGRERESRSDFSASEDDEVIVKNVAADPNALGYVGYVYYERHRQALRAVRIDDLDQSIGRGAIEPSPDTVRRGLYRPLSRPLFIYVNTKRLDRPEVKAFVDFFTRNSEALAVQAGCIPLNPRLYDLVQQRVLKRIEGSLYQAPDAAGRTLDELLNQ